uniref:Uncharacterized protein n=1 Tax=Rhizophora mucronata TaxID=61149 RepID=A0A2P2N3Y1_RHIMU
MKNQLHTHWICLFVSFHLALLQVRV